MRKSLYLLPALIFSIFSLSPTNAQDTGWPIEERCLGKPVQPAPDWTYDGTILMTGNSGIHGVNAAWETPHVLTFLDDSDLWGGALSPDGMLYASPRGDFTITESNNGITEIDELRLYSVDGQRNYTSLPVDRNLYVFFQYTHAQAYWRDNESFIYAYTQFNTVTGEIVDWPTPEFTMDGYPSKRFHFSPDWTRWIFPGYDAPYDWKVADLTENQVIITLNITTPIAWKPDSTGFVATITDDADIPAFSFVLFDRDGNKIETIFNAPDGQEFGLSTLGWSEDSRYFAFSAFDHGVNQNRYNTLYIADSQNKVIYNTCTAIGDGLAWSPITNEIAFIAPGEGLKAVSILDMSNYSLQRVAWHSVAYNRRVYQGSEAAYYGIIGWREN